MLTIRRNDSGEHVKRLQLLLRSALIPHCSIAVDGKFGRITEATVKSYQRQRGLAVDGIVGPQTWAALGQLPAIVRKPKEESEAVAEPRSPATGSTDWMDIAEAELGVARNALPGQHNSRILEYYKATSLKATRDEVAWCSAFVNWVMGQAGHSGTDHAVASTWLNWGRAITSPQFGAVAVIKDKDKAPEGNPPRGYHVGFYVSKTSSHVRLLGGNQSDMVKYSNYPLNKWDVHGYRLP